MNLEFLKVPHRNHIYTRVLTYMHTYSGTGANVRRNFLWVHTYVHTCIHTYSGTGANVRMTIAEINHVLFHDLGYKGNIENYYDAKNSFIVDVLKRRCYDVCVCVCVRVVYY